MSQVGSITPHFTWQEARCNCCRRLPPDAATIIPATAAMLESVRALLGDHPIHVLSWYRCPYHNARTPGAATHSQHLTGRAVDIACQGLTARQVQRRLKRHWPRLFTGFGRYPGFTHLDIRPGPPGLWNR